MKNKAGFFLIVLTVMFLWSCASIDPVRFVGPNGNRAYSMDCGGGRWSISACYQKAGELCWNGYTIIGQDSGTAGVVVMPVGTGYMGVPVRRHTLAIECK